MSQRNRIRKSFSSAFKARGELCIQDRGSPLSEISDISDQDWGNHPSKLQPSNNIADMHSCDFEDPFELMDNVENQPNWANMDEQLDAKQHEIDRVQQIALDLQDRFVWDLSLAIKKDLFRKHYNDNQKRVSIANCGISQIVERNQNDPRSPEEWKDWITSQFPKY